MKHSRAQIVATIGPASSQGEMLASLIDHQMDVARFNFSWSDLDERKQQFALLRDVAQSKDRHIPIVMDLPGPRVDEVEGHTYHSSDKAYLTDHDKECILFGILQDVEYVALSFVGKVSDVEEVRSFIAHNGGSQRIISKIEREIALENIDAIITTSDAIMIARGDLGKEIAIEKIPFVQASLIQKCNDASKPVITATQMLLSMTEHNIPTRAEVTDVASAIIQGSDAVMLSEETAKGSYPLESVMVMERIIAEAEKHGTKRLIHSL